MPGLKRDGARWTLHYDPQIAVPFKAATPERASRGRSGPMVTVRRHPLPDTGDSRRELRSAFARHVASDGHARAESPDERDSRSGTRSDVDAGQRDCDGARFPAWRRPLEHAARQTRGDSCAEFTRATQIDFRHLLRREDLLGRLGAIEHDSGRRNLFQTQSGCDALNLACCAFTVSAGCDDRAYGRPLTLSSAP